MPSFPECLPHCHLSHLVTSSPPSSRFRQEDEHQTEAKHFERGGEPCVENKRRKRKKISLPFLDELQRVVTSQKRCCSLLALSSRLLPIHSLTCSRTHPLSHTLRHASRLPSSSVRSLNGFVSFSSLLNHIFCHTLSPHEEPVEPSPSLTLLSLPLAVSLCLRLCNNTV